jgi:hypothetical protein
MKIIKILKIIRIELAAIWCLKADLPHSVHIERFRDCIYIINNINKIKMAFLF